MKVYPASLGEIILNSVRNYPDSTALKYKEGHHFDAITYSKLGALASKTAESFQKLGLLRGDRVVINFRK
jgi:acyl-CoA synthetase (AMP-forming)/AMP-acid ligase II